MSKREREDSIEKDKSEEEEEEEEEEEGNKNLFHLRFFNSTYYFNIKKK